MHTDDVSASKEGAHDTYDDKHMIMIWKDVTVWWQDDENNDNKKSPRSHGGPYYSCWLMHKDDVSASKEGAHDTYDF